MNLRKLSIEVLIVAREAGDQLLGFQPDVKRLEARKDYLTDADLLSERIIFEGLRRLETGPDVPFYSEEAGGKPVQEGLVWVIDPLDGTINYSHQDSYWGVSLALVKDGRTVVGVVVLPDQGLYLAACTEGIVAERLPHQRQVRKPIQLSDAHIWADWTKSDPAEVLAILAKLKTHCIAPQTRLCCTASTVATLIGNNTGYIHPAPEPFDIAAVGLIAEQKGFTVTDMSGEPWTPYSKSFVVAGPGIHGALIELLR